jgi:DNA-binding MarR family transcriptional regulator/GNAT superfamily N-acetyltransferase
MASRRSSPLAPAAARVDAVRAFNRFYTRQIGVLQRGLLHSPYSLIEVRVLYELAHGKNLTATDICSMLGIDAGYLSRILRSFERDDLIGRRRSKRDARQSVLRLTATGRATFAQLDSRQSEEVEKMLSPLAAAAQVKLVQSMNAIEGLLAGDQARQPAVTLRSHRAGDMGWVMSLHGELYDREYAWDARFEALVGEIVVDFLRNYDAKRERCWIAELDGERVGSIFLVKETSRVAKLRLLLVDPKARGRGVGKLLVQTCVEFARNAGYTKVTLWTNSVLDAARHIYESEGFSLVKSEKHESFGHRLTGQHWELALG